MNHSNEKTEWNYHQTIFLPSARIQETEKEGRFLFDWNFFLFEERKREEDEKRSLCKFNLLRMTVRVVKSNGWTNWFWFALSFTHFFTFHFFHPHLFCSSSLSSLFAVLSEQLYHNLEQLLSSAQLQNQQLESENNSLKAANSRLLEELHKLKADVENNQHTLSSFDSLQHEKQQLISVKEQQQHEIDQLHGDAKVYQEKVWLSLYALVRPSCLTFFAPYILYSFYSFCSPVSSFPFCLDGFSDFCSLQSSERSWVSFVWSGCQVFSFSTWAVSIPTWAISCETTRNCSLRATGCEDRRMSPTSEREDRTCMYSSFHSMILLGWLSDSDGLLCSVSLSFVWACCSVIVFACHVAGTRSANSTHGRTASTHRSPTTTWFCTTTLWYTNLEVNLCPFTNSRADCWVEPSKPASNSTATSTGASGSPLSSSGCRSKSERRAPTRSRNQIAGQRREREGREGDGGRERISDDDFSHSVFLFQLVSDFPLLVSSLSLRLPLSFVSMSLNLHMPLFSLSNKHHKHA